MRSLKKLITLALIATPYAFAFAGQLPNPLGGTNSLTQLLMGILNAVIKIGIPVLVVAVVYVGFMFVRAQGKPEEIKTAGKAFFYTLIGAGVVMGAKVLSLALCETVKNLGATNLNCTF